MNEKNAFEVSIEIMANTSKYWGFLWFIDRKGNKHMKNFETIEAGSKQANTLKALIKALGILQAPCLLTIYTDMDHLIAAYQKNWIQTWKENGWQKAGGKELKNNELWKRAAELLSDHSIKFVKEG